VAGMVDIVARAVAEGNVHTMSFKTSEVIFGGGRLKTTKQEIPLDYAEFLKVYEGANPDRPTQNRPAGNTAPESASATAEPAPAPVVKEPAEQPEAPKPRTRKRRE